MRKVKFFIIFLFIIFNRLVYTQNTNYTVNSIYITNNFVTTNYIIEEPAKIIKFTNVRSIILKGKVNITQGGIIDKIAIQINSNEIINLNFSNYSWQYQLDGLNEGTNLINVYGVVNNLFVITNILYYVIDTKLPNINLNYPLNNQEFFVKNLPISVYFEGTIDDEYGISKVNINLYNDNFNINEKANIISNKFNAVITVSNLGNYNINIYGIDNNFNMNVLSNYKIRITSKPDILLTLYPDQILKNKTNENNYNLISKIPSEEIEKKFDANIIKIKNNEENLYKPYIIEYEPTFDGKWKIEDNTFIIIIQNEGKFIKKIKNNKFIEIPIKVEKIGKNSIKIKEKEFSIDNLKFWYPEEIAKQLININEVKDKYYLASLIDNNKISVDIYTMEILYDNSMKIKKIIPSIDKEFWIRER